MTCKQRSWDARRMQLHPRTVQQQVNDSIIDGSFGWWKNMQNWSIELT